MKEKRLVGERVELRRHSPVNYRLYGAWYADPEIWRLTELVSGSHEPCHRRAALRGQGTLPDGRLFAIHLKDEREPIGVLSLMNISEANASAELSIIVGHPEDRHHGYGAEAIATLLDYAFGERGLNRVGLSVFEFNEDAISAYAKLGFREEGRLRRALKRDGAFHDAILMSVLKDEWVPTRP